MKALYEARNQMKMTRKDVAGEMDVSETTVYRWEAGERKPSITRLMKLANLFHTTIDALVNPTETAGGGKLSASRGMRSTPLRKNHRTRS